MNQKAESRQEALEAIDIDALVRQVLDNRSVEVADWQYRRLQYQAVDQSGKRAQPRPEANDVDGVLANAVADVIRVLDEGERNAGPMRGVYRFTGSARSETGSVLWST